MGQVIFFLGAAVFIALSVSYPFGRRRSGKVLVDLGPAIDMGFLVVLVMMGLIAVGLVVIAAKLLPGLRGTALLGLLIYFTSVVFWAVCYRRVHRQLGQNGLFGPGGFVPWSRVKSYEISEGGALRIIVTGNLLRERVFHWQTGPERKRAAEEVLAERAAGKPLRDARGGDVSAARAGR